MRRQLGIRGLLALLLVIGLWSWTGAASATPDDPGSEPTTASSDPADAGAGGGAPDGQPSGTPEQEQQDDEPTTEPGDEGSADPSDGPGEGRGTKGGDPTSAPENAGPAAAAAAADPLPPSQVGITKTNSLDGAPLTPGAQFTYTLVVRCSGLEIGCVNQTFTDVLPDGLDVTSLPQSIPGQREVSYHAGTRTLSIRFVEPLQEPVGAVGLNDGATRTFDVGMRLPADSTIADGTVIANTGTTVAENSPEATSTSDVTVSVPREVRPVATKSWADGSAVALSGETSTLTLGIRNGSSSSAVVDELLLTEADPDTFEHFDLTGVELTRWPAGAGRARLWVCTDAASACDYPADYEAGPTATALGALGLPAGTSAGEVTGFVVVFDDASGEPLPFEATGGTVEAGLVLRDTFRSTDQPLRPTSKVAVANCVVPGAVDDEAVTTSGPQACDSYDVLPNTVVVNATKSFRADTDGDFSLAEAGEYAVLGRSSPVSATVSVQNRSAFPLREIRVVEPDAVPASEFAKLDVTKVRLRFPTGATGAHLVVQYADGSADLVADHTTSQTVDVARAGTRPTRIEVVYTGVDGDGQPSIAIDATAGLDVHGTLNAGVTDADLPDGDSPGVGNCASYQAKATTSSSTGTASGNACATLPVERERRSGQGVKTVSQTQLPEGQPIQFSLTLTNNGNVPLVDPVLYDPPVDGDGRPRTDGVVSPFAAVQIVSATVRKDSGVPDVALEVFDPAAAGGAGAWVAYVGSDAALLQRAIGIRALVDGELTPTKRVFLDLIVERRDGVADDVQLANCFTSGAIDWSGDPACSPAVETAPAQSGAAINKRITPGELVTPVPGLPEQTAQVRLTIANTGNMSANRLQLTDARPEFYDAVDVGAVTSVQFPRGANRVQVDALVGGAWVAGTPLAPITNGSPYPLPSGVAAEDVTGLRFTFTNSSGGYDLRPCEGAPTPESCTGIVVVDVHPRVTLRSDAETPIPAQVSNQAVGGYETSLQNPGELADVDPVTADLTFGSGDPQLDVEKTPDSAIAPGESAPFRLTVTNSGSTNLPDLVVRDLLPAGLTFDESFAGGEGFRIVDAQVPAGTEPVPTPTFETTTEGGRIAGLRWEFGDWLLRPGATFVIEIQVRLSPGVNEGQSHVNEMGATSPVDGFACAPGAGTATDPEGTWCTDSAEVRTKAGAAFEARKWVAGRDSLGWWNDRSDQVVPVGDASCPSRTEGGRTFTAFPCVALVNPGDRYDYLMTFVNAGTEPATDMRVIDRFPVQGDKGVVLSGLDRGTQWANRPTLATAPTLIGAGALAVRYADTEADLCTDDLQMTQACPAGTWDGAFGPGVVGMQVHVDWAAAPLAPGEGVGIRFSMDTPLDVPRVADPTVAWNSFGHAERTQRSNGQSRVLPPTEPIKVGVATAYGALEVSKTIGTNPAGLPLEDRVFDIDYRCTIDPIGGQADTVVAEDTLEMQGGDTQRVDGIPAGAECEVWEEDALGGVTSHPSSDPAVRVIEPHLGSTQPQQVNVTNDYPLAALTVEKVVDGDAAAFGEATEYPVDVSCTWQGQAVTGFPTTVTLTGDDTESVDAPAGAVCTAVETDDGGATSSTVTPADGVVVDPAATEPLGLVVTNTFEQAHLRIRKELSGAGASPPPGPFVFDVDCTFEGTDLPTEAVTLARQGAATEFEADVPVLLPVGASCTVTETDSGGADTTPAPVTVELVENAEDNTVTATFVNEFSAGTVAVGKELAGDGATEQYAVDAVFSVLVTCAVDDETQVVFSGSVDIQGGERIELTTPSGDPVLLPLGTRCWGEETATGGATSHTVNADSFATGLEVVPGAPAELQELELEVVNTFDLASWTVDKVVDGDAAGYAEGREFTVAVTCVLPQNGVPTPLLSEEPHTITDDQPVVVDGLPVGAECWVAETGTGGATSTTIEHADQASPAVVAGDGSTATTVTNTFAAAELVVGKRVVNGPAGPYSFELACTTDQGEVPLAAGDATFELRDGRTRTISVPLGAECTVVETDVPAEATVTFEDSDRTDDGVVTVAPSAAVTVVNTFPATDDNAGNQGNQGNQAGDDGSGLPDTGGPRLLLALLGLVLLAGGGAVLLRGRRAIL